MNELPHVDPIPPFMRRTRPEEEYVGAPEGDETPEPNQFRDLTKLVPEEPIAACEAIFTAYKKMSFKDENKQLVDKVMVQFLVNPADVHDKLAVLPLREIVKLYVTKPL